MKAKEIRLMSKQDLNVKFEELKKELVKLNAQISTGTTPKSPGQVKQVKKNIARILTILNEKKSDEKAAEGDKKT
ncbi:MAG: 50S ribosomal protein L29 [Nanoarchaeota archaeon]|nr:50S ribosomal protein L29 [Nanoarchaeota archaeon]